MLLLFKYYKFILVLFNSLKSNEGPYILFVRAPTEPLFQLLYSELIRPRKLSRRVRTTTLIWWKIKMSGKQNINIVNRLYIDAHLI